MLILLSPAKTLDTHTKPPVEQASTPQFLNEAAKLVKMMSNYTSVELMTLMKISQKIALENVDRFSHWKKATSLKTAKQAIYTFQGDVYTGFEAATMTNEQLHYAQDHLRILSGLYGLLKPLDVIMPYRLEMGTKINSDTLKDIYTFWGDKLQATIDQQLATLSSQWILNLASNEYSKAACLKTTTAEVTTPVFKDWKNGQYKLISFFAKKARGSMARFCIDHQIKTEEQSYQFNINGYKYSPTMSQPGAPVFIRKQ